MPTADTKQPPPQVREQDFLRDPEVAFARTSEGRVHVVDDKGRTKAIISVPRDPWPADLD